MQLLDAVSEYVLHLIKIFVQPETTKALFQAATVLGSAFIIGAKDQGAFLYKEEMVAYEAKFQYEEKANVEELSRIDCSAQKEYVAACKLAQHKLKSIQGVTNAFVAVMHLIYVFILFTGAGSIASFLLKPLFLRSSINNSVQPTAGASANS